VGVESVIVSTLVHKHLGRWFIPMLTLKNR
jgi:hypothetical protein